MRVIAGSARGCRLVSPEGESTRPTADRIRETIFNILASGMQDAVFLDLFAGSGAIGIEALSRGAKSAVFADIDREAIRAVQDNLQHTRLLEKARVLHQDFTRTLAVLSREIGSGEQEPFDIVYIDPPYRKGYASESAVLIAEGGILQTDGLIILEQGSGEEPPKLAMFETVRTKEYKTTTLLFMRNR